MLVSPRVKIESVILLPKDSVFTTQQHETDELKRLGRGEARPLAGVLKELLEKD